MAFNPASFVWETTTTTGTGALTLGGAANANSRTFSSILASGDTCWYAISDGAGGFEEGLGTYTSAGNTLTRTTVYASTNGGAAVNWGAGTKNVTISMIGSVVQSLFTPGSTGIPNRTADNTWAYLGSSGTGNVARVTDPVFNNSISLTSDTALDYETTNTTAWHTTSSDAHTSGNGLIDRRYTYYTDASNYEGWQLSAAIGSGDFQISHIRAGTYAGNTRGLRLNATSTVILSGDAGIQLVTSLVAGTTTYAPIVFSSGTNLTTATAGAEEYDGVVKYFTNNASNRGVAPAVQYILNNGNTYTLTSQTAAQKAFNSPTNGALTLPTGLFEFEGYFELSSLSATSGSFGFALGGTATMTQHWMSQGIKTAAGAAGATIQVTHNTTNANTTLVTANTTTSGWFTVKGTCRVTVSGTLIPQISLGVASAAVVSALSYFRVQQIANTSTRSVGNWS